MSFNNTESFCTMTMSVFYRKVPSLDVGMISWANLKCMNIVKLSVNQWTSIFPPSSPVWLNATCTLAVTDTLPHRQQQGSSWRSRGLSQTFPTSLYVCSPIAPTKSSPGGDDDLTHMSRTYSCRSDGMITKSWCRMQIWTPLFFNTVFNVWLAQRSNNRTPLRFTLGRFSHSNLSRSHLCPHKCWSPSAERWSTSMRTLWAAVWHTDTDASQRPVPRSFSVSALQILPVLFCSVSWPAQGRPGVFYQSWNKTA